MTDIRRPGETGWYRGGRALSRAERLEVISLVATIGPSECSAWIIPMLERGGPDEDRRMEKPRC